VPLNDVFQGVAFGLLEVVRAVEGFEPRVQEEAGPVRVAEDERGVCEVVHVLGEDEVNLWRCEMREGVDYGVGWDDGDVFEHQAREAGGVENVGFEGERRVGNQGFGGEGEDVRAGRVEGEGVAEGRHQGPGVGLSNEEGLVGGGIRVEVCVACERG